MTNWTDEAKERMAKENAVIAVEKDGVWKCSGKHGIAPLLDFLRDDADFLKGARVADRVVGRAAAMLMIHGGVSQVFAMLISEPAVDTLEKNKIPFCYEKKAAYIQNRAKDGGCPMEQACLTIEDPAQAYEALKAKVAEMAGKREQHNF